MMPRQSSIQVPHPGQYLFTFSPLLLLTCVKLEMDTQKFLIVLMRLRLNLLKQDLAYQFDVLKSAISSGHYFKSTITTRFQQWASMPCILTYAFL